MVDLAQSVNVSILDCHAFARNDTMGGEPPETRTKLPDAGCWV